MIKYELALGTGFRSYERFVRNDLLEKKIKSSRVSSKKFLEFKKSYD